MNFESTSEKPYYPIHCKYYQKWNKIKEIKRFETGVTGLLAVEAIVQVLLWQDAPVGKNIAIYRKRSN